MTRGRRNGPDRHTIGWNAGLGLTAAIGILVGVRAIASWSAAGATSLLRHRPLLSNDLGVVWSDSAVRPQELQLGALEGLVGTVVVLALACAVLGLLNAVIVLADAAAARRRADAVRMALGAGPRVLIGETVARLRTLLLAALSIGLTAGVSIGFLLRMLWPEALAGLAETGNGLELVVSLVATVGIAVLAALSGVSSLSRRGAAGQLLRSGARSGDSPGAVFVRSALSASHIGVGASCLLVALVLLRSPVAEVGVGAPEDVWVLESAAGGAEAGAALRTLAAEESALSWSDSTPGALLGLGIRDIVVTQCGNCYRGLFPAPLWNTLASHFAVGPGWFEMAGVELVGGRDFASTDGAEDELVAIVDETLARSAFEAGDPLGRQLRIGRDHERWYTVVGIVRSHTPPALGSDGSRPAVYLSSRQMASGPADLLVRGDEATAARVEATLVAAGVDVAPPRTLSATLRGQTRPLTWLGTLVGGLGALALLLAGHGSWVAAEQSTRRRLNEFSVRRAVGASTRAILRLALTERVRLVAVGLFLFSVLGTAALAGVGGSAEGAGLKPFLWAAGWLAVVSFVSTARAARAATRIAPSHALH